jgi:hypothetical protein
MEDGNSREILEGAVDQVIVILYPAKAGIGVETR